MGCCTTAYVSNRRDVKREVVSTFVDLAVANPACADGNGRADGTAAITISALWTSVSSTAANLSALKTGKGCGTVPSGIPIESGFHETTVAGLIEWGAKEGGEEVDCWGSYIRICWLWAVQIIDNNSHTFSTTEAAALKARVATAIAAAHARKMAAWGY